MTLKGSKFLKYARTLLILIYAILIVYYFITGWEGARKFVVIMVPLSVVLWVVNSLYKGDSLAPKINNEYLNLIIGVVLSAISMLAMIYLNANFWDLVSVRMGFYTNTDLLVGGLMVLVILWFGALRYPLIFGLITFFLINALYGKYFPGVLKHPGLSLSRVIAVSSVDFSTGIFESLSQIATTVISAFMLFVGILNGFNVINSITTLVFSKLKYPKVLPQSNVLAGVPIGMVTGSAGAATATIGSVTVPMIKKLGVPAVLAAAMAAAAGVGAQLMPPIMGTAAFVMSEALSVPYFDVMIRGFVPALVYFIGVGVAIAYISLKHVKVEKEEFLATTDLKLTLLDYANIVIFTVGIILLMVLLATWTYAPLAAFRASAVVLLLMIIAHTLIPIKNTKDIKRNEIINSLGTKIQKGLEFFSIETANLTLLLALLGILKAFLTTTGLSMKVGSALIHIGEGNLYLVALLAYIFGYIVGMGVPPLGTYVIIYPIVVPAMIRLGINPWAAHFTAFFLGVHSEFAPPMSVSAATISRVANVSFTRVVKELVKMGIGLPIIIFVTPVKQTLVIEPGLQQIITGIELALGIIGIETAFYWRLHDKRQVDIPLKGLLIISSLLLVFGTGMYTVVGAVIVIPLLIVAFINLRKGVTKTE